MHAKIYENELIKHSVECSDVSCMLDHPEKHTSVFALEGPTHVFFAATVMAALNLWVENNKPEIESCFQIG